MKRLWRGLGLAAFAVSLALWGTSLSQEQKVKVLIITGQNNHDWRATTPILKQMLEETGRFIVDVTENPQQFPPADLAKYDVYLLNYNGARWGDAFDKAFLDNVFAGKGVVIIHAANNAFSGWKEYDLIIGRGWRKGAGHGAFHQFKVEITDPDHPITKGLPESFMHEADELYHNLTGPEEVQDSIRFLAWAFDAKDKGGTGKKEPMAWVLRFGKGRVFHTPLGHAASSMKGIGFQTLVRRGTEWAATGKVTIPVPEQLTTAK